MNKTIQRAAVALAAGAALALSGCSSAADTASDNLSDAADDFRVERQVFLYNGITGQYAFAVTGKCSLGNDEAKGRRSVTCQNPDGSLTKHLFDMGDNVTLIAVQSSGINASKLRPMVWFKPEQLIPDINRPSK